MTRLEIQTAVLDNVRRTDKTTVIQTAINLALREICTRHRFRQLMTQVDLAVVAGDISAQLPADFSQLQDVRLLNTDSQLANQVEILPMREVQERYPNLQSVNTGRPSVGYEFNGTIRFLPTSAGDYTLQVTYDALHPTLGADTDATVFAGLDNPTICWVTRYVYQSIQQYEDAGAWEQMFEKAFKIAERADKDRPVQIKQMQRVPEDDVEQNYDPRVNIWTPT